MSEVAALCRSIRAFVFIVLQMTSITIEWAIAIVPAIFPIALTIASSIFPIASAVFDTIHDTITIDDWSITIEDTISIEEAITITAIE
jgi:hypothetical protein